MAVFTLLLILLTYLIALPAYLIQWIAGNCDSDAAVCVDACGQ